ncbi:MAG: radical SAM protein [Eubacteriales bacterium]|nr:radical SAM protein [Eubacteriales bacterium]
MDILFVNQIDFCKLDVRPQLGQLILNKIVNQQYESECINFDLLNLDENSSFKYIEDMDVNIDNIVQYILCKSPSIVGFYTICNSFELVIEISERIKKLNRGISIILGGPHASVLAEEILANFDFIDYICVGESEKIILPLVNFILSPLNVPPLDTIPSICYKDKMGMIHINQRAELLSASELTNYSVGVPIRYDDKIPFVDIEGGRGCPFQCSFCSTSLFWGRVHRIKPIEDIIEEMKCYRVKYDLKKFYIVHDHFTANRSYIFAFCDRVIKEKLDIEWSCSSRIDILDEVLLDKMREANCVEIYLGIETGSKKMQKDIKKYLNIDKVEQTIKYMKQIGIDYVTASFIFGFPHETVEDFRDTLKLIEKILLLGIKSVQLHRLMLFTGGEEIDKVSKDALYFDLENMRMTKSEKRHFTSYGIELIKKYPKLFSQFYTFDTEVFIRYKNFDDFLSILTTGMIFFNKSVQFLIKKYSLECLFNRNRKEVDEFHKQLVSNYMIYSTDFDEERNGSDKCFDFVSKIIQNELDGEEGADYEYLQQIYSFEKQYYFFGKNQNQMTQMFKFDFDIFKALREEKIVYEMTFIRFSRLGGKLSIEKISQDVYYLSRLLNL